MHVLHFLHDDSCSSAASLVCDLHHHLRARGIGLSAAVLRRSHGSTVLQSAGVHTHFVRRRGCRFDLSEQLIEIAQHEAATVFHSHSLGGFLSSAAPMMRVGMAHVHTQHEIDDEEPSRFRWILRNMDQFATVVSSSETVADWKSRVSGEPGLVVDSLDRDLARALAYANIYRGAQLRLSPLKPLHVQIQGAITRPYGRIAQP